MEKEELGVRAHSMVGDPTVLLVLCQTAIAGNNGIHMQKGRRSKTDP